MAAAAITFSALAGCGGSGTSTSSVPNTQYLNRAEVICSHYTGGIDGIVMTIEANSSSAKKFKGQVGFLGGTIQFLRTEMQSLSTLPQPRTGVAELITMYQSLDRALTILQTSASAVRRGDVKAFKSAGAQAMALAAQAHRIAVSYGFRNCLRMMG